MKNSRIRQEVTVAIACAERVVSKPLLRQLHSGAHDKCWNMATSP